jgi:hypothetical protein
MGIRFNTNTWRAPLQLIDCWLPHQPTSTLTPTKPAPRLLQRFAKAGWLSKPPTTVEPTGACLRPPARHCSSDRTTDTGRWNAAKRTPASHRSDGRFALSGRIDQVCAELDRLAALEQRMFQ